jgi:hypothetical protein
MEFSFFNIINKPLFIAGSKKSELNLGTFMVL